MKLDRFTKVLINLVIILLIALLLKFFITIPKDVYAKPGFEYKLISLSDEHQKLIDEWGGEKYQQERFKADLNEMLLNRYAKKGWRLHSYIFVENEYLAIFER